MIIWLRSYQHHEPHSARTTSKPIKNRATSQCNPQQRACQQRFFTYKYVLLFKYNPLDKANDLNQTDPAQLTPHSDDFNDWIQESVGKRSALQEQTEQDSEVFAFTSKLTFNNRMTKSQQWMNIKMLSRPVKDIKVWDSTTNVNVEAILPEYDNTTTQQVADLMHIANTCKGKAT